MKLLFDSLNPASIESPDCIPQGEDLVLGAVPRRVEGGEAFISSQPLSILDARGSLGVVEPVYIQACKKSLIMFRSFNFSKM